MAGTFFHCNLPNGKAESHNRFPIANHIPKIHRHFFYVGGALFHIVTELDSEVNLKIEDESMVAEVTFYAGVCAGVQDDVPIACGEGGW